MRVDQLVKQMGDQISVEWKSFMLRSKPKTRSKAAFVEYTNSWLVPNDLEPSIEFNVWASDAEPPSHSLPALSAGKLAEQFGSDAYDRFHHNALAAYFTQNRTVSDRAVLVEIADESGIDAADFASRLVEQEQSLAELVIGDHNQAVAAGINAVPTVVLGAMLAVPGVQDVQTYERLATRLIEKASQET